MQPDELVRNRRSQEQLGQLKLLLFSGMGVSMMALCFLPVSL